MGSKDGVIVTISRRAEIDTRAPFRSVREAVTLFGEKVLAGEVYASRINEIDNQHETSYTKLGSMTSELEETKQTLQKAKEDTIAMSNTLTSLKDELEKTKRELHELKLERESEKQMMEFDMEDLKYVEHPPTYENILHRRDQHEHLDRLNNGHHDTLEFQKKRYVTFANAPVSQIVMPDKNGPFLERHHSLKKKKKQPLIPLIGGLFSRKKKNSEVVSVLRTP